MAYLTRVFLKASYVKHLGKLDSTFLKQKIQVVKSDL
jgi:hypothetical protein